eukprot:scaffold42272_cov25-Prasinocladus_malaysianus.AAC.6
MPVYLRSGDVVKNILGSSVLPSGARKLWEKEACHDNVVWPCYCSAYNCRGAAVDGGHVKVYSECMWTWFIIPVCKKHNPPRSEMTFSVTAKTLAVEDHRADVVAHFRSWDHHFR